MNACVGCVCKSETGVGWWWCTLEQASDDGVAAVQTYALQVRNRMCCKGRERRSRDEQGRTLCGVHHHAHICTEGRQPLEGTTCRPFLPLINLHVF